MAEGRWMARLRAGATVFAVGFTWAFLLSYFKPSLLLLDTTIAGGDTPSFLRPIHHLRDTLLPAGNPQGWDLGNFCGYAPYQFYFLPPSLTIVALSYVIPLNVAFKLVTVVGSFLLPLTTTLALRALGYAFPVPALGAVASLLFLFNEGNSMWGGNIPSTLAGEFAHSLGFAFAVLFLGLLYRGIEENRRWRSCSIVLAVAGLCHPVAFLNAATPGLFFLFDRRHFARNVRYLALVYAGAVLLMGFWLVPLVAKLGYATSINWKWHFASWKDLMPRIFYPVAALAGLDILWMAVYRRPTDRPGRYLLFGAVAATLSFFNGTAVGLPEIRFVPCVYFLGLLLAVDLVARLLALTPAAPLGALAFAAGIVAWVMTSISFIPTWINWNYEGLERKPSYGLLTGILGAVHGTITDPRVAYENSPLHDRFGSMRVFEDLPLLAGRPTLEGVLLQTAVTSPPIYWLQSQISKQGSGVIPGYSYPSMDLARATPRLALFNASDMITVTPEVTGQLEQDPRWQRTFHQAPYSVFHLKNADGHYVRVPRFRPVLLETARWKRDFVRWFATDSMLDVPIVAAASVPADERDRFPLASRSAVDLPRERLPEGCRIEEHLDHMAIDFTTTCPGLPHVVAVSYYPNWHVEGARRTYLVSPAFMLVFPDGPHVRLVFRRVASDWLGIAATLAGLGLCLTALRRPAAAVEPSPAVAEALGAARPWALGLGIVFVVLATTWNVTRDYGAGFFYQRGWKAFAAQDYPNALWNFSRAIELGGESSTAADATFFHAASLLRSGDPAGALAGYRAVVERFPDSVWVAESHYHVGLCLKQLGRRREAKARFRYVMVTYPGNRWAGFAAEQFRELRAQRRSARG
ncbi:MAG: tetratricopeptide repeat protein [Deltaproteobacteria bacterium]|nr:MAG: tetratricopeptide repeat protein [Deltaproteobacteria bacterium]